MVKRKITIVSIRKVKTNSTSSLNNDLQWLCDSLGLFSTRDKDKSCFRMFVVLLKSLRFNEGLTSDQISDRIGLSRGAVVHHLHKLIEAGLIVNDRNLYYVRVNNLTELIDELEKDVLKTFYEMRETAKNIDKRLKL